MHKAVFLDKDGTLIKDVPYNVDPDKIELFEDVPAGLQLLKEKGFKLVIVTNQSGVALGYFEEHRLEAVQQKIEKLLQAFDIQIDGFYYCPHYEKGTVKQYSTACTCRKPQPGLLVQAANELNIDLSQSWMIGDILNDVEAGNKAGCKTILIDNGGETEWILTKERTPDFTVKRFIEAAQSIVSSYPENILTASN